MAHLDQTSLREPLEGLAHGGTGDTEHLGETTLAGQRVTGRELAVDDLAEELVEDVLGDEAAGDGFQGHVTTVPGHISGGQVVRPVSGRRRVSKAQRARAMPGPLS